MILTMYPNGMVDLVKKAQKLLAEKKQKGTAWHKHNSNCVYFDTDIPLEEVKAYMGDDLSIIGEVITLNQQVPARV